MGRSWQKIVSLVMVFCMLMTGAGQNVWATEVSGELETPDTSIVEEVPVKEDFQVIEDIDKNTGMIYLSIQELESLASKGLKIQSAYAYVGTEDGASEELYKLGVNGDGRYRLELDSMNYETESISIRPVVVYAGLSDSRQGESLNEECTKVSSNLSILDSSLELDKAIIEIPHASEKIDQAEETDASEDADRAEETDTSEDADRAEEFDETKDISGTGEPDTSEDTNGTGAVGETEEDAEVYAEIETAEIKDENSISAVDVDGKQKKYKVTVAAANYAAVKIAVWSELKGQDDLRWYTTVKEGDTYTADVIIKNHISTGTYIVHAYGTDTDGNTNYITGVRFTVDVPTVGTVTAEDTDSGFVAKISGVTSPSGIEKMEAAIWCNSNQSDLIWKTAEEENGEYVLDVDATEHRMLEGKYTVHFYAIDGNGFKTYCGGIVKAIDIADGILYAKNIDKQQKIYTLVLSSLEYTNVQFAVWSQNNGQDDLKWYRGEKSGNSYIADVDIKNHGSTGIYYVHAYGYKAGKAYYINGLQFKVTAPSAGTYAVEMTDNGFQVTIDEISAPSGIVELDAAVWCSGDQSDLVWKTLRSDNGKYILDVKISEHKMLMGTYIVHVYAVDGNGIKSYCGGVRQDINFTAASVEASVENDNCDISVLNVKSYGIDSNVKIAVWSLKNGQDDLVWYTAAQNGNNYSVNFSTDKLVYGGTYQVHAYLVEKSGKSTFLGGTKFVIDFKIGINNPENGDIVIDISGIDEEKQFTDFSAEVWTKDDQSDLLTIRSVKSGDGNYSITIPISKFGMYSGEYHIKVFGNYSNGKQELLKEAVQSVIVKKGTVAPVSISDNKMLYTVTLNDVDLKGAEKSVRFAVWSETNGQDDIVWYTADKIESGYRVNIPIYQHKDKGKYYAHIYAVLKDGSNFYLGGTAFQVDEIIQYGVEVRNINNTVGSAQIVESIANLGYEFKEIKAGIWNSDKGGSVVWYSMSKITDTEYAALFEIGNHGNQFGKYTAHIYATDTAGKNKFVNGISFTITPDNTIIYEKTDGANGKVLIYGANVNGKSVSTIRMATWSNDGDQDDLKWIDAKKDNNGTYYVNITRSDYKRSGYFTTHIYGYIDGKAYCLGGVSYLVYKSGEFDEYAQTVMHNIIFAVETGGQVYGKAQYDCFAPAYNISQKETAITIGAGGWFATEAQKLLKLIREEDPLLFVSLDTENISYDIDHANWTTYGSDGKGKATILRGSAKAKCIQALISTKAGIKVQNHLVDVEMTKYVNEAKALGVDDLKGQMFLANIRHLGGYSAMKRVVEWCKGDGIPLTMRNLYNSMRNHTTDKNGNGVGANKYNSRHVKVMGWLDKYIM